VWKAGGGGGGRQCVGQRETPSPARGVNKNPPYLYPQVLSISLYIAHYLSPLQHVSPPSLILSHTTSRVNPLWGRSGDSRTTPQQRGGKRSTTPPPFPYYYYTLLPSHTFLTSPFIPLPSAYPLSTYLHTTPNLASCKTYPNLPISNNLFIP